MNIRPKYQRLVVAGSVKECRKWMDSVPDSCYSRVGEYTRGYINIASTLDKDEKIPSLQKTSAAKICAALESESLSTEDLQNVPEELLCQIVQCMPIVTPTAESNPPQPNEYNQICKRTSVRVDFTQRDKLIAQIRQLRPNLSLNWEDSLNNERCVLKYQMLKGNFSIPGPEHVITALKEFNINVTVVLRNNCQRDREDSNTFSRVWVLENKQKVFHRYDLPQEVREDDHPAMQTYGHLLSDWLKLSDKGEDVVSPTLGAFRLYLTGQTVRN